MEREELMRAWRARSTRAAGGGRTEDGGRRKADGEGAGRGGGEEEGEKTGARAEREDEGGGEGDVPDVEGPLKDRALATTVGGMEAVPSRPRRGKGRGGGPGPSALAPKVMSPSPPPRQRPIRAFRASLEKAFGGKALWLNLHFAASHCLDRRWLRQNWAFLGWLWSMGMWVAAKPLGTGPRGRP